MANVYSPIVTWQKRGHHLWTKMEMVISDPNPDEDVAINCILQGGASPQQTIPLYITKNCGSLNGWVTESDKLGSSTLMTPSSTTKHQLLIAWGYKDISHTDLGSYEIRAVCEVTGIKVDPDDTNPAPAYVVMSNYVECYSSTFLLPNVYNQYEGRSAVQIVRANIALTPDGK